MRKRNIRPLEVDLKIREQGKVMDRAKFRSIDDFMKYINNKLGLNDGNKTKAKNRKK